MRTTAARATALDRCEAAFFNNMALRLDYVFAHRLRTVEGKDGKTLNEVGEPFLAEIGSGYV